MNPVVFIATIAVIAGTVGCSPQTATESRWR